MIGFETPGFYGSGSGALMDDGFTALGTIERDANTFNYVPLFAWRINGSLYSKPDAVLIEIDPAADGFYRTDISYVDTNNDIKHLVGEPSENPEAALAPTLPLNTLLLSTWSIFGAIISDPTLPALSGRYVEKSFFSEQIILGEPNYINITSAYGMMSFTFQEAASTFDFYGFTNYQTYRALFDGKITSFKNETDFPITLKHQSGVDNIKFNFRNSQDYNLMPGEILLLRYSSLRGLENFGSNFIFKEYLEVKISDLVAMMALNELVPTAFYKVNGVDIGLYGGTTIYTQAIASNKIDVKCTGAFYNPDYSNIPVWSDLMYPTMTNIVGDFTIGETVTADNGARAIYKAFNLLQWTSGDWNDAVSMEGDDSGATSDISDQITPTVAIDDKRIWGGKVWQNSTGDLGAIDNNFDLNPTDWNLVPNTSDDYILVFDPVEYDVENDLIVSRKDILNGNTVKTDRVSKLYFEGELGIGYGSAIKYFQWGNNYNADTGTGVYNNIVNHGLVDIINFIGTTFNKNTIKQFAYFFSNTFTINTEIGSNILESGAYFANSVLSKSTLNLNTLFQGSRITNLNSSEANISNCVLNAESRFNSITLINGASIIYNYLNQNSGIEKCSLLENSSINSVTVGQESIVSQCLLHERAAISGVNLEKVSQILNIELDEDVIFGAINIGTSSLINLLTSGLILQNLQHLEIKSNCEVTANLSAATIVYGDYSKTITQRQDGELRVMYVNDLDILIINLITT